MKKTNHEVPAKVYQELAAQIRSDSEGLEYSESEAEVVKNGLTYSVNYTIHREFNTVHSDDYDVEPYTTEQTYCDITDSLVTDSEGSPVQVEMDYDRITELFDTRPVYSDED